jgi:2-amino-4-hydroxy-6-hydroxymethyldihydropteridine diphosphokinase
VTRAVLCLGSNQGDSFEHLRSAVAGLARDLVAVSTVYETPPWGDTEQPAYLNAAVLVSSMAATPRDWLERAWTLERAAGRQRDSARRFGPRTLDVDVIAVWADDGTAVVSDDPELTIPHPRAHLRAFVLRPMLDVTPDAELPGYGSVAALIQKDPVATDLFALTPRPDLDLASARTAAPGTPRLD